MAGIDLLFDFFVFESGKYGVRMKQKRGYPRVRISSFCVIPERFERSTHSLEGCCSIQLSYGTSVSEHKISAFIPNLQKNINPTVN